MNADSVKFNIGDTVYLRVNQEKTGMVTNIYFSPGSVSYGVTWDDFATRTHYDIELTLEKTFQESKT